MVENLKSAPEDNKMLALTILRLDMKNRPTDLYHNGNKPNDTSLAVTINMQCKLNICPRFIKTDIRLRRYNDGRHSVVRHSDKHVGLIAHANENEST